MAEIVLDRVTKSFSDGVPAVRDVSFKIEDGELFVLVGPSGCGKSTLLNLIVGLQDPTSGALFLDGRPLAGVDPKDRDMAMVFQSYALYPHLTAGENIAFPLRLRGLPKAEIRSQVLETARLLGIEDLLGRRPQALSGGQRQRVAMGRAIVRRPKVFLLDEPLSNLDAQLRAQMRAELARLQRRLGTTTLYVTHDQTEAMTLGDRVAILRFGSVQQVASPREIYARPANVFVASFVGTPTMNLLVGRLDGGCLSLSQGITGVLSRLPSIQGAGAVIVGIRPEAIARSGTKTGASVIHFDARVDLVEWLGAELFVHLDVGWPAFPVPACLEGLPVGASSNSIRLIARLEPTSAICEGDQMRVAIAEGDLHFFDVVTGSRLSGDSGGGG